MAAMKQKRMLFGGAMRCAGLAVAAGMTAPALAEFVPGSFQSDPNFTSIFAFDDAYNDLALDQDNNYVGGFPMPLSYSGPGGMLHAEAGPTYMGALVHVGNPSVWNGAGAQVVQIFTVDDGRKANLEWNLTGTSAGSLAYIVSFTSGPIAAYGTGSGSVSINLTPGTLYGFIGRIGVGMGPGDQITDGYVRLTWVPAPGAIALLGLGMVGVRRRRREVY